MSSSYMTTRDDTTTTTSAATDSHSGHVIAAVSSTMNAPPNNVVTSSMTPAAGASASITTPTSVLGLEGMGIGMGSQFAAAVNAVNAATVSIAAVEVGARIGRSRSTNSVLPAAATTSSSNNAINNILKNAKSSRTQIAEVEEEQTESENGGDPSSSVESSSHKLIQKLSESFSLIGSMPAPQQKYLRKGARQASASSISNSQNPISGTRWATAASTSNIPNMSKQSSKDNLIHSETNTAEPPHKNLDVAENESPLERQQRKKIVLLQDQMKLHLLETERRNGIYEAQIKRLEGLVEELQAKNAEQDNKLAKNKILIEKLKMESSSSSQQKLSASQTLKGSQTIKEQAGETSESKLSALNMDLLNQNTQLRLECGRLQAKLEFLNGSSLTDGDSESRGMGFDTRGVAPGVLDEVGRILNPNPQIMPKIRGVKRWEVHCQTDALDTYDPTVEEEMMNLKDKNDKLTQSYNVEKDINSELLNSIQSLQQEIDNLSTQFAQLSNDAEVAMASERVALDKLDEQDRLVHDRGLHIHALSANLTEMTENTRKLERELYTLQAAHETLEKSHENRMDPLLFLESQWHKDRQDFYQQTTVLRESLQYLESENKVLRGEVEARTFGLPDHAEWADLIAERSLMRGTVNKLENKITIQSGAIVSLESQVLKLENQLEIKAKNNRDLALSLSFYKNDHARREAVLKTVQADLKNLKDANESKELKAKLDSSISQSKELLIRDFREKIKNLELKSTKTERDYAAFTSLQAALKEHKFEIARKVELVKHWKLKSLSLEKELADLREATKETVPARMNETIQAQLRMSKEKLGSMQRNLEKFQARDTQFRNVLIQFVQNTTAFSPTPVSMPDYGLDNKKVSEMAEKLSKQILNVEWSTINAPFTPISTPSQISSKLASILDVDNFERPLFNYLTDTIQS